MKPQNYLALLDIFLSYNNSSSHYALFATYLMLISGIDSWMSCENGGNTT